MSYIISELWVTTGFGTSPAGQSRPDPEPLDPGNGKMGCATARTAYAMGRFGAKTGIAVEMATGT